MNSLFTSSYNKLAHFWIAVWIAVAFFEFLMVTCGKHRSHYWWSRLNMAGTAWSAGEQCIFQIFTDACIN